MIYNSIDLKAKIVVGLFIALFPISYLQGQSFEKKQSQWADSVFSTLNQDQKLGQLFMVAAYSNRNEAHYQKIDSLVSIYHVGGLIFFQGGPMREAVLTNRYQAKAKVPLMIGMDAEWGLGMRLMDSTISFPRQMTLGATRNPKLAYQMGTEIAAHCKRLGIHVNFAPAVDVNNNPDNPVIGVRSFGEEKEKVADFGIAYMKGLQQHGVMANAKHFPGHGDTDADSHYSLPVINHDKKRLNDLELYPFKKLMADSLMSVMVAHIHIPALDNTPNIATTLSPKVVTDLLKEKLKFKGLVFTDALNMKGVAKYYAPGEVEYRALLAGNDVLLFAEDVPTAVTKIKQAFAEGKLDSNEVYERVKKILKAKYWCGLDKYSPIDTANLYNDLNTSASKAARNDMYAQAITLLKNENNILPYKVLDINSFASVSVGLEKENAHTEMLDNYAPFTHFFTKKDAPDSAFNKLIDSLSRFTRVVVGVHNTNNRKKENFGVTAQTLEFIKKLQGKTQVTVVYFGNLYGLTSFTFAKHLVCAYEDNEGTQMVVPQLLFGAKGFVGKLPVTFNPFENGDGLETKPLMRLAYGYPESVGIPEKKFYKLDSILNEALWDGSTPGMQVLVAKKGVVIYQKNLGFHSYDRQTLVNNKSVYDLASVTKTAATMQAIMFLHQWKRLDLDEKISFYLPETKASNKEKMVIRDMLVHQAGLPAYVDFWRKALQSGRLSEKYFSSSKTEVFSQRFSKNVFVSKYLADSVQRWAVQSALVSEKADTGCYSYKYSDLTFFFMKALAEKELNQPLPAFLNQNLYKPLGLRYLGYLPLQRIAEAQLVPTEEDKTFRNAKVQGFVHDQNASILGGVAGHAGLFGNTNDLAILGQMLLQGGTYGGVKYFEKATINEFTRQQYGNNRRALGWDRPFPPEEVSLASPRAFGHTGFTGTAWWIDPEHELVFVLLANRTYPFADNKRFTEKSVRTKALNAVYEIILNK